MTSPLPSRPASPTSWKHLGWLPGFLLCASLFCSLPRPPAQAQDRPSEDDVKAAYLFNFGKFVRRPLPDPPPTSFDVCLIGHDEMARTLTAITANEQIDGRPVRVKQFDRAADARSCAIVFLGTAEAPRLDKDLEALQGTDALTVSDVPHFLEHGGMIQFLLQNNRVRFAVNLDAVHHSTLQLSSELLKVAASITGAPAVPAPEVPR